MTRRHEPRKSRNVWIVMGDRAHARFFEQRPGEPLQELEELQNAEGEAQLHEVGTDRPGYFKNGAGNYVTGDPETDWKHQVAERFAQQIVDRLEHGRYENKFGGLVLIAEPMFLGVLRSKINGPLESLVIDSVPKDYMHLSLQELAKKLPVYEAGK